MDKSKSTLKICRIATVPFFLLHHLNSTLKAIMNEGHELHLVCSGGRRDDLLREFPQAIIHEINIERDISILKDLISLFRFCWLFRVMKFDIVHSTTPKAGLITALAGFLTRVPVRMHTFTGQAWFCRQGLTRWIAKSCDRIIITLNTACYADGKSQVEFMTSEGICAGDAVKVLGQGSLSGVNARQFNTNRWPDAERLKLRKQLGIPSGATVINFTGRINVDKGIRELTEAFTNLLAQNLDVYWVLVGPFEELKDKVSDGLKVFMERHDRIRLIGYYSDPAKYYAISDIFCLPSYREGFGSVVVEAAMMGIPAVSTRVIGLVDSVVDDETGLLVDPKDSRQLFLALSRMIKDQLLRAKLGGNAEARALKFFTEEAINRLVLREYGRDGWWISSRE